jgi:hypothetical protein
MVTVVLEAATKAMSPSACRLAPPLTSTVVLPSTLAKPALILALAEPSVAVSTLTERSAMAVSAMFSVALSTAVGCKVTVALPLACTKARLAANGISPSSKLMASC